MNNRQRKKLLAFPCMGCGKTHGERPLDRRRRQNIESTMRRINRRHPPVKVPFKFNLKVNTKSFVKAIQDMLKSLEQLSIGFSIGVKTYAEVRREAGFDS